MTATAFSPARAAEKKEPPPPPPALPVPQELQVLRGEEREIFLKIYGRRNQPITYVIRKRPQTGTLTPPVSTEAEVAVVRYRPPADRKITKDSFQYAARSAEGVSAAVTVDLTIVDLPAQLSMPQENTFPKRLSGTEETQVIEVENLGGNMAEGEAFVDPPWVIEGPSTYKVEPKGRAFFRVKFAPQKSGTFNGELRLSSQPDRVTTLRGIAVDPIAVNPPLLTLQPELTTLVSAGAVEVTNNTDAPLKVQATASEHLLVDPETVIGPGETRPFIIRTVPGQAHQITGRVVFEGSSHRTQLPVSADALPPVIRSVERSVNFGQLPPGAEPQFQITLQNVGGKSGTATLVAPAPLRAPAQPIPIAPGETKPISIGIDPGTKGAIDATLEVRSESGSSNLRVRGGVGSGIARIASSSPDTPKSRGKIEPPPAHHGPISWSPYENDVQQPVDQRLIVRVAGLTPNSCTLEWRRDLSSAPRFVAEMRQLAFADGQLVQNWRPHASFKFEPQGDHVRGVIAGLEPGKLYSVRIRAQEAGSPPGSIVVQTAFSTPLPETSAKRMGWKSTLFALASVWVAVFYWRRRRNTARATPVDARKTQKIFD